jgi:C-terminal processing protease CtpA/Prc
VHFSKRREGGAQHSAPFSIGAQVRAEEESPGSAADVLVIVSVVPGGACESAGVRAGDELVEVGRGNRVVYDLGKRMALCALQ